MISIFELKLKFKKFELILVKMYKNAQIAYIIVNVCSVLFGDIDPTERKLVLKTLTYRYMLTKLCKVEI